MSSKERPILFSAPMVRAILDGSKTQTRRVVKWQGPRGYPHSFDHAKVDRPARDQCLLVPYNHPDEDIDPWWDNGAHRHYCPYGSSTERLWVREAWAEVGTMDPGLTVYRADYPECVPREYENVPPASAITWKPSIHMHRHRSRIDLEITGIRVERLQDISYEDALAEGVPDFRKMIESECQQGETADQCARRLRWPQRQYQQLWEEINGRGSWDANPWVWVVEFRRVKL